MASRIRIDDDASEKLDDVIDKIDASKKGLASELIREGCEEILEDS